MLRGCDCVLDIELGARLSIDTCYPRESERYGRKTQEGVTETTRFAASGFANSSVANRGRKSGRVVCESKINSYFCCRSCRHCILGWQIAKSPVQICIATSASMQGHPILGRGEELPIYGRIYNEPHSWHLHVSP